MQQDGVYVDNLAVQAVGMMLSCCIRVVQAGQDDLHLGQRQSTNTISVGYLSDAEHYISVSDIQSLEKEHYYAVYYTNPWAYFIGRIVDLNCRCDCYSGTHIKMMFLKTNQCGGTSTFNWARSRSPECIANSGFVFDGPLTLSGAGPFTVDNLCQVEKKFVALTRRV